MKEIISWSYHIRKSFLVKEEMHLLTERFESVLIDTNLILCREHVYCDKSNVLCLFDMYFIYFGGEGFQFIASCS